MSTLVKKHPAARPKTRVIRPLRHVAPHWMGWLVVGLFVVAALVSCGIYWYNHDQQESDAKTLFASSEPGQLVSYPGRNISYATKFNHLNATHLKAAKAVGVQGPLKDQKAVEKQRSKLTKIRSTRNYMVDDLDYSLPYLTKGAAAELDAIGAEFADILERNGLPHYRFIVTSVLRTEESVKALQRSGNINSTTKSAHCYGTTFDITYKRFDKRDSSPNYMSDENLKLVLGQALLNEQRAGNIFVKYEHKQACFHITSRR